MVQRRSAVFFESKRYKEIDAVSECDSGRWEIFPVMKL